MKGWAVLTACILTTLLSYCQTNPYLIKSQKYDFIFNPVGLFESESNGSLFVPSSTSNPVIANSGIWVAGKMPDGSLRASINLNKNITDFDYGPLSMSQSTHLDSSKWFKTWVISKDEINIHINSYKKSGYIVPPAIANWPVNPPAGYDGILAPFKDWNANGVYEPELGEAPVVEGDLNVFTVYNDYNKPRVRADSGLGVEIKHFVYMIDNPEMNQYLILNRVLVTNRNNFDIQAFKLGVYADLLLGQGDSNFVRSFPQHNAVVGYCTSKSDSFYGNNIPSFGLITLNKPLAGSIYLTTDNDLVSGFPTSAEQINNYLSGRWRNGKALTYGGNGIDASTPVRFVYSGLDDPLNHPFEWVEENSGIVPGKRNFLVAFDSINLLANLTSEYRFAYQIIPNSNHDTALIRQRVSQTQTTYLKGDLTDIRPIVKQNPIIIFPNPSQGTNEISIRSVEPVLSVTIYDMLGNVVYEFAPATQSNSVRIVPQLSSGIYCVQVETASGVRFVKQSVN